MKNKDYLDIAHENLIDTLRLRALNIDGGKVYETDDFLLFSIGTASSDGHLNGCVPKSSKAYKETFEEAEKFFADLGFDYSVWVREDIDDDLENILLNNGFFLQRDPGSIIMKREEKIQGAELPEGYSMKEAETQEDIDGFALVVKEAFKKNDKIIKAMFSARKSIVSDDIKSFIIYNKEGKVVSGTMLNISDNSTGLYFVGTLEAERGKGLGKAVVREATNYSFDIGKEIVVLQASKYGIVIYAQLGFDSIGLYKPYGRSNTPQNIEG